MRNINPRMNSNVDQMQSEREAGAEKSVYIVWRKAGSDPLTDDGHLRLKKDRRRICASQALDRLKV